VAGEHMVETAPTLLPSMDDETSAILPLFFEENEDMGEGMLDRATGNPVAESPAPHDYYKLSNMRQGGAMVLCDGRYSHEVPTGNLQQCADACTNCKGLCKGFVHTDAGNGKCLWKSQAPGDTCSPPTCNQDSYAPCPPGRWSDGISTNAACYAAPPGYSKKKGNANCDTGGTDIACNDGSATLETTGRNLEQCASLCNTCAVSSATCVGFSVFPIAANATSCRFKSVIPASVAVSKTEDLYTKCPPGTWSNGLMGTCKQGPRNYVPIIGKDGGMDIDCNGGLKYEMFKNADGNITLEDCAKTCDDCRVGTKVCAGFIRREDDKCNFKTLQGPDPMTGQTIDFATIPSSTRDAYRKCPGNKFSDGSSACQYPDDWKTTVVTGGDTDCQCNSKPVDNRRLSSATWTFDIFSDVIAMFVASKPHVVAPCPNASQARCGLANDTSFRTSAAGGIPTKVRITANQNDGWCMKEFCVQSAKLGKKWSFQGPAWMNPGDSDDGACLPPTVADPHSNWGWCRYLAPNVISSATNCNTFKTHQEAFWEYSLTEGDGAC